MNVVDSSGWLEYFADGPNAAFFSSALQDSASLIVPVVTIYEVFKIVLRERGENDALQAVAAMQKGRVIDLNATLAILASRLSVHHSLPMADSVILATAKAHSATLWTEDSHLSDIPGVKYIEKKPLQSARNRVERG